MRRGLSRCTGSIIIITFARNLTCMTANILLLVHALDAAAQAVYTVLPKYTCQTVLRN